ncbi:MAG TPA: endo-1,4-beta-xylanase [Flavisolibacter sp.]
MKIRNIVFSACLGVLLFSCKKVENNSMSLGDFEADASMPLKDVAGFPIGVAVNRGLYGVNATYTSTANRDFNSFTFENEMKHDQIVQNNGTYDYSRADALMNAIPADKAIYGHVLAWHSQQNRTYLRNYTGLTAPAVVELLSNSGFESGLTGWSTFNTGNPAGTSTITSTTATAEVRTGTTAMKVVNPIGYPGSQWRVQVSSGAFTTVPGKQYAISYWVKATSSGGSIRLSTGPSAPQYQGDQNIGTAWQQVTWTITASLTSTTFLFDMGQATNTYFIDDVSVKEVVNAPSGASVALKVDTALNTYITNMVSRYKNKVKAWDVINEMFTESGEIRNENNSPDPNWFVWSHYLGRDFGVKAFNYAKAADPTADLFINDYNLETSSAKLDSLIKYVAEIRTKGAKVDGIGTQMHINWNTSMVGIEEMFRKLGATGLKIRITELDIATLLGGNAKSPTPQLLAYQAQMAKNVVESYLRNVPKAQRAGITIWGLHDSSSWRYNNGAEFPLFYNNDFTKKPAYSAFLQALKGQ